MQLKELNFAWLNCLNPSYIHKNLLVRLNKLGMQVLVAKYINTKQMLKILQDTLPVCFNPVTTKQPL